MPVMKTCKKCKETKAFELFSKASRGVDGYNPRCKVCVYEYDKALREKLYTQDPEGYRNKVIARNEKYKDRIKENAKAYREKHGSEINRRKQERIKQRLAADPEFKARYKARRKAQYERKKDTYLARGKQKRAELTDAYVKSLMGISPDEYVSHDVLEARRQQILELREKVKRNADPDKVTKYCIKCESEKPKSEFYKNKNRLASYCKKCMKEGYIAYVNNHPEEAKKYRKQYYKDNKEKQTTYTKEYYKNNTEKVKALGKAWRENNPDKVLRARKNYVEQNREKIAERARKRWKNLWLTNPDQIRAKKREEYVKRRDYILAYNRKIAKQAVAEISDAYVKHLLSNHVPKGMNVADIPKALIEAKRLQLKIRRMANENSNTTKK
jgi:hypothetical protein